MASETFVMGNERACGEGTTEYAEPETETVVETLPASAVTTLLKTAVVVGV